LVFLGSVRPPSKMIAKAQAALALALGCCLVPYAAPYSLAPGPLVGRVGVGLRAAATAPLRGRALSGWGGAAWQQATAGRRGGAVCVRMVNAELLQSMDEVELNKMKVAELKTVCEACGLSKAGKKADLIARILELQKATLAPEFPPPRSERAAAPSEAGSSQSPTADDELEFQMSAMEATNSHKFPI
jgi:hypothetical protein